MSEEIDKTGESRDDKGKFKKGYSGNPKGLTPETEESHNIKIAKKEAKEEMKQRIMRSKDSLLNSQMNLAKGCQFLFVIETIKFKDKDNKWKEEKKKPVIVEDQETIENYLAGELDNEKDEYYFMTTQKPDNKAIDSMFDRAFDKARQNVGLDGGEEGKPIPLEVRVSANQSIKEFLNGNSEDITKREQGDDKGSIPVQSKE